MTNNEIKGAREQLGLNQTAMANAMGVHRGTWLKWESGDQGITAAPRRLLKTLVWLDSLGILPAYLDRFKK